MPPPSKIKPDGSETPLMNQYHAVKALHRDAVRFQNGKVLSLQALGQGVSAYLCEPALEDRPISIFGAKAVA